MQLPGGFFLDVIFVRNNIDVHEQDRPANITL